MALFVTAIKMVWSAGHWGNQVTQEQAPVQAHSSNKVAQNQSLPGIVPMYLSVKYNSSISVFVLMKQSKRNADQIYSNATSFMWYAKQGKIRIYCINSLMKSTNIVIKEFVQL